MPDNLLVSGNLDLEGTGITFLPDNLSVGESLYLQGCHIDKKNVPKHLIKKIVR